MFPHTATIYNKYKDAAGIEKWKRTVLSGVFWDSSKGAIIRKTGASSADGLLLIVPMGVTVVDKSAYKKPKEWESLPDKSGSWTLQEGDTVILGSIVYEVVKSSKELQQFDDVLEIINVDTRNYGGGMDLWEVTGK